MSVTIYILLFYLTGLVEWNTLSLKYQSRNEAISCPVTIRR